jgi:hypothetical protein
MAHRKWLKRSLIALAVLAIIACFFPRCNGPG